MRVTKSLLESITSRPWDSNNLDILRVELRKNLWGKRFLFVFDDLWNDNYNDWDELITPLINEKAGSRVIITTRQQKVAEVARTYPIYRLEPLSTEDCWSLVSKHAFGGEDFCAGKYQELEAIGRKISKKCGGLPVAAKTLGGLLRSKVDLKEWTNILNSSIWNLLDDNILPALLLSYLYLPSNLKRCFAYCSIFPKNFVLHKKEIVLLWMAEGFLEHSHNQKEVEEVGDDYFVQLLSRSLIQQSNDDVGRLKFVMHDLVNDLATIVAGKSCCRLECGGKISKNVRHMSYIREEYDISKKFKIFYNFKCLRSFLPIGFLGQHSFLSNNVVDDLLPTLKSLRVLSLSMYVNVIKLPDSIGVLVQLRYLNLSRTGIKSLPDTICNLHNLQTLDLSRCEHLTELPTYVGKLISLRHLDITGTDIKELPMEIVKLKNLQTLSYFVVGRGQVGLSVKEHRIFTHLQGRFNIKNLHNVIDAMEAYDADLKRKDHIEELELQWGTQTEDSKREMDVLDALRPSINLKTLRIDLYGGTSFPSWLADSSFSNMVSLYINNCEYCVTLPPLGQLPSLKDLYIDGMKILETIGPEFYYDIAGGAFNFSFQPFPSLEMLEFMNMLNWKEWLPFEGNEFPFPRLKRLFVSNCPELKGHLPSHLSSIVAVRIAESDSLLTTMSTLHWLSSVNIFSIEGELDSEGDTKRTQCSLFEGDMMFSLPKMILTSSFLHGLDIQRISSLTEFPADGLPHSLKSLSILDCQNLAFLPPSTWRNYTSLVTLELNNSCDALKHFQLDGFPVLQMLDISDCNSLESIFISETSSSHSSMLQTISLYSCKALLSLPQRMETLTTLEEFEVYECDALRSVPRMDTLTSLKHSRINVPQDLTLSLSEGPFLPPNLQSITIESTRMTMPPITDWGLQCLNALSRLTFKGDGHIVNTLLKEPSLPISLVHLSIYNLSAMKSLEGNGLRHLSSLETLTFTMCSELESLSKDMFPSALKSLYFSHCSALESLPEDTLPSSLKLLSIYQCPLLEARYETMEHWSSIAHIPFIRINGELTM